jgi:hypothetical protein
LLGVKLEGSISAVVGPARLIRLAARAAQVFRPAAHAQKQPQDTLAILPSLFITV